jgi:hypothetical protein
MGQVETYFRALETAVELVALVRGRPDMPEHLLVSNCLRAILSAIAFELEQARCFSREPSVN